ncbi:hypothetical protein EJ04DRAFT_12906 [Polyplosphaeria fusca]|uniref:Rhodopsin domain-containing protein n=1 Tax=Polyplosphaeria fusca TaxID=682080 RepID=A0A9P4QS01_9PLEO|nr:hypothetical protein EJ04DRAFT_12906 [Polyplosphaeria fusca]
MNAILAKPYLMETTSGLQYVENVPVSNAWSIVSPCLTWTTIYAVKFSFLVFFKPLVRHLRQLTVLYWVTVVGTAVAYVVSIGESLFLNFFLARSREFFMIRWSTPFLVYTIVCALLDISTDLMIISIPCILIRESKMERATRWSVASFLCLSIFMVICSIIRLAGLKAPGAPRPDMTWRTYWQQAEGCIAVMAGSVTALRMLFIPTSNTQVRQSRGLFAKLNDKISSQSHKERHPRIQLPTLPSATFSGMRKFIRRNHREGFESSLVESAVDPAEMDYHQTLRRQTSTPLDYELKLGT